MRLREQLPIMLLIFLGALCCTFVFWMSGGVRWLQSDVFPPRPPRDMPPTGVWIDAPPLPLSWHRGWWFGCRMAADGASDWCRLVGSDGIVYEGQYLSCKSRMPVADSALKLIPPKDSADMWVFGENVDGVAGFLPDGDILLPKAALTKCSAVLMRLAANR
jgi:hypothetical protein